MHALHSIANRLGLTIFIGGLLLAGLFSWMEYDRAVHRFEVATSQQLVLASQNMQESLRFALDSGRADAAPTMLALFRQDPRVTAMRLSTSDGASYTSGPWPSDISHATVWALATGEAQPQGKLNLARPTLMVRSFVRGGQNHSLELLIDGPQLRQSVQRQVAEHLRNLWIFFGIFALAALLVMRWYIARPLEKLIHLIRHRVSPEQFAAAAETLSGEFADMAHTLSGLSRRLQDTVTELQRNEHDFKELYQIAPMPLICIGTDGCIKQANDLAAQRLGFSHARQLLGKSFLHYVAKADHHRFDQYIQSLQKDRRIEGEFTIEPVCGPPQFLQAQFVAFHDFAGQLTSIVLSPSKTHHE